MQGFHRVTASIARMLLAWSIILCTFTHANAKQATYPSIRPADCFKEIDNPLSKTNEANYRLLSKAPVVIPFHYGPEGTIKISIKIGAQSFPITLDTGCSGTTLWAESAPHSIKIVGEVHKGYLVGHAPDSHLGPLDLGVLPVFVCPKSLRGVRTDADAAIGLLGGNVLKSFDVTLDYGAKHVIFSKPGTQFKKLHNPVVVPIKLVNNQPLLQLNLNGKTTVPAGVDTGAVFNLTRTGVAKTAVGESQKLTGFVQIKDLNFGNMHCSNSAFCVDKGDYPEIPTLIGADIFSRFLMTFDYQNRRLLFESRSTDAPSPINKLGTGFWHLTQGRERLAVDYFTSVLADEPELANCAYRGRAQAYRQLNEYGKAIDDYGKIIDSRPKSTYLQIAAYDGRAWAHMKSREPQKAISDLTSAINIEKQNLDLALATAKATDSSANQAGNNSSQIYLSSLFRMRGWIYVSINENDPGIRDCDQAIALDPHSAANYLNRGYAFGQRGDQEKAIKDYGQAIKLDPKYTDAYTRRAYAYERLGQHDKAMSDLTKTASMSVSNSNGYTFRASLYEKLGLKKLAQKDRDAAKALDEKNSAAAGK